MHCLGAVTGGIPSPNGVGGRGGILSMFRALGVLVCEGRIQGPPRGYKEGPHCAAPTQTVPNDHVCEEDNYLVTTETAVAIIFKIILLFEHEREINEVNLNLRNFFTFFFFFFPPLLFLSTRSIRPVRSISCAGPRDRGPCCNRLVPVHRGSVVQQLSMRFGEMYEQKSDLHRAVLINFTMATSVGDAAGVLVCLRRS